MRLFTHQILDIAHAALFLHTSWGQTPTPLHTHTALSASVCPLLETYTHYLWNLKCKATLRKCTSLVNRCFSLFFSEVPWLWWRWWCWHCCCFYINTDERRDECICRELSPHLQDWTAFQRNVASMVRIWQQQDRIGLTKRRLNLPEFLTFSFYNENVKKNKTKKNYKDSHSIICSLLFSW